MGPHVRRLESLVPRRMREFGGKARNLAELARAGFPVPAAYAISSELFLQLASRLLHSEELPDALLRAPAHEVSTERLVELAGRVRTMSLPAALSRELAKICDELGQHGEHALVVRSSSQSEDEHARSAAGLHDTVLGVRGTVELEDAIRTVWASVYDPKVFAYLRALGVALTSAKPSMGMGVVVQTMVEPEVSGVMFTAHPVSGNRDEILINAAYGLGKDVVDGSVSPDTYRIDKRSGFLRDRTLGEKANTLRWSREEGLTRVPTPEALRARGALDDLSLARLAELGRRIENHFGDPRDVEWSMSGSTIYIVQARPMTAAGSGGSSVRSRAKDRSRIVWSNVNVGEALPGVVTPLTWSILSGFSERGFRKAFGALGCTVPRDAELIGNFRGRIYLNMSEFMAIASQVPGLSVQHLLSLGGGGEMPSLESIDRSGGRLRYVTRLPQVASRFVRENARSTERALQFEEWFEGERQRIRALDFRLLSATALHRVLAEIQRLLDPTGDVLLNVYGNLLASALALRIATTWILGEERAGPILGDLLTGLSEVDSAAPGFELLRIAEIARGDLRARDYLRATAVDQIGRKTVPEGPTRRALDRFFELYGDRGPREAEIAAPRWKEEPSLVFATLKLHLEEGGAAPGLAHIGSRRARAENELLAASQPFFRPALRRLIGLVQHFTRLRERLRARVVTVLGMYRDVALDASRRLRALEPGVGNDAAFFLSISELHAVLKGDAGPISPTIRRRRIQDARDRAAPAPPPTFVGFPPAPEAHTPADVISGLPACPGRVRANARCARDAKEALGLCRGEILVVPLADVGWTPLFLLAGGLVAELGGPLSHASVVAREFGLPTVVNVKGAMASIRTGDLLELDGERGLVTVIERADG